jgi:hypothetical protein
MPEKIYDRATTAAIAGGVASVLLYDHAAVHWLAIVVGAFAGLTAVSLYVYRRIHDERPSPDSAEACAQDIEPREDVVEEALESPEHVEAVEGLRTWTSALIKTRSFAASALRPEVDRYIYHDWAHAWYEPSARLCDSHRLVLATAGSVPDPKEMVEAAVNIANKLASDKFEVVLTPYAEIIVRPSSTPRRAEEEQLSFPELTVGATGKSEFAN